MVKARVSLAFTTLVSEPPPGTIAYSHDLVSVIIASFNVCMAVWDASMKPGNAILAPMMRALWPHIVDWAAFFHPARRRIIDLYDQRDMGHEVGAIAQAYLTILESEDHTSLKIFLHAHPDLVTQALQLWLRFPSYIPTTARKSEMYTTDVTATAYGTIRAVVYLRNILLQDGTTPQDNALFLHALQLANVTGRTVYRAIAPQTNFLLTATVQSPSAPSAWTNHFCLLSLLLRRPELAGSPKSLRNVIPLVIAGGNRCITLREAQGASWAIQLVADICRIGTDNRPLVRAVRGGIFELLRAVASLPELYDVSDMVTQLCAGMTQARILRAFRLRRPPHVDFDAPKEHLYTWMDVAQKYEWHQDVYNLGNRKDWRYAMSCHNHQGPHDNDVRICPCGDAFYCSGSCQRMDWNEAHREFCRADDGPWGLHGALSLEDVVFICQVVRVHIAYVRKHEQITPRISSPPTRACSAEQTLITVDLTDVLPMPRHVVTTRIKADGAGTFAVEAIARLGGVVRRCPLPFVYSAGHFD